VAGSGDGKKAHFASSELDMQARLGVGTVGYFGSPKYKWYSPHRRDLMHREVSLLHFILGEGGEISAARMGKKRSVGVTSGLVVHPVIFL
jgi:hypothetical protein